MEDMTLNSAANAEVNVNESTSVNENVSAVTDTPTILPESPVIGFQAVDAEGNVLGFVSKAELVNEAKQALYADLAILEANRPTTLPANAMLANTSTLAATDVYEDQLAIKSDAPYIRGLDAAGNPIRISKADLATVVGGLIGIATQSKRGLATSVMVKSSGATYTVSSISVLKIDRDTEKNCPAVIEITSCNGPSWDTNTPPRKVLLTIPFDSGTINNIYAKNLFNADNISIYKDDSFNLYIKTMDIYSTLFMIKIIQNSDLFTNISIVSKSSLPDLESYEKITIH